jgi:hypothetical protein
MDTKALWKQALAAHHVTFAKKDPANKTEFAKYQKVKATFLVLCKKQKEELGGSDSFWEQAMKLEKVSHTAKGSAEYDRVKVRARQLKTAEDMKDPIKRIWIETCIKHTGENGVSREHAAYPAIAEEYAKLKKEYLEKIEAQKAETVTAQ